MRFSLVTIAGLVGLAVGQDVNGLVSQLPVCSLSCISVAASQVHCDVTDFACQCSKISQVSALSINCLVRTCSAEQVKRTKQLTDSICQAIGTDSQLVLRSLPTTTSVKALGYQKRATTITNSSPTGSFATSATSGSSVVGSNIPAPTNLVPTTVATAGAVLGAQPALLMVGAVAAGAFLM